ncbi:beta-N-acetylhexosaminidase [Hamadaea sp. NPDC051192]|uniref:beta-N-acetylhexosaminidase n=1 Tax=Hamadaea sp. NPDC051192 TaxID=3154940 RepID=UPI003449CE81
MPDPHDLIDALVPLPAMCRQRPGVFRVGASTAIGADGASRTAAWLLHDILGRAGFRVPVVAESDPAATIVLSIRPAATDGSPEGYEIAVEDHLVRLTGNAVEGLARAVQTLRQMLAPAALRQANGAVEPIAIGCCDIADSPRYSWRGVHLDVARHFMPKSFILKLLDLAALHRLNVLHLHLTDDQGWRLDIPSFPGLAEIGSWRAETLIGHNGGSEFDGTPHGGYYTHDDLREIVAYAAQRSITVVPEIDLPGHVQAALAAYPELGNTGRPLGVRTRWGISDDVLAPTEQALAFARTVVDVVAEVFPGPWLHLGGDECPRTQWHSSPKARSRAEQLGLSSVEDLQSWFMRTVHAHAVSLGKRVVGWDEVVDDGGMPADTLVMAWRSMNHGLAAMRAGHDVVMCPKQRTYFDYYQAEETDEPLAIGGLTRIEDVAAWDPDPTGPDDLTGRVLGVQGQLWTEYLPTPEAVEYMAFPRLSALAEVGWTPAARRDQAGLVRRLGAHLRRLEALDVNYRPLEGPRPWQRGGTGARRRI